MPHDRHVTLPGGRRIRARTIGASNAPAIVYLHGTPDSRLMIDAYAARPSSTPVRLVSFDRPGYGGSDFEPFSLASVADDARAVMDDMGIERFAVVGQSGGGPFALACAAQLGDRVTGVGIAAGPAPCPAVPGARAELIDTDRQALDLIGIDDAEAARLFSLGFADMAAMPQEDDDTIVEALLELLPPDAALLGRPEVASGLAVSMREALRQGVDGCAWDNVAWVGEWQIDVTSIRQPTWLWYGQDDPLSPPAHGEWLTQQIPQAELVVRQGEGHLGIFAHWDECSSAVAATVDE